MLNPDVIIPAQIARGGYLICVGAVAPMILAREPGKPVASGVCLARGVEGDKHHTNS